MTKFAMINTTYSNDAKKIDAFNKKFTASNLKKSLKCKDVIELKRANYDEARLKLITSIETDDFENLANELSDFNISSMTKNSWYSRNIQKYFAFSDDIDSASSSFIKLQEKAVFTLFEIDEDEIESFIENIENIKSNNDLIEDLNQAKESLDTLQGYERQFSINLTSSDAEDEIDTAIRKLEYEVDEANEELSNCLEWN